MVETKIQLRLIGVANGRLTVTVPASGVRPWVALVPAFAYTATNPHIQKGIQA